MVGPTVPTRDRAAALFSPCVVMPVMNTAEETGALRALGCAR